MQDRKNGGERMEAVLLGLTPEVRVSDRGRAPLREHCAGNWQR